MYINIESDAILKLYNLQGNLLLETIGKQVDLSAFTEGMYLLQINGKMVKVILK